MFGGLRAAVRPPPLSSSTAYVARPKPVPWAASRFGASPGLATPARGGVRRHASVPGLANLERNQGYRQAFRRSDLPIGDSFAHQLESPYVPPVREYPHHYANEVSRAAAREAARRQVGLELCTRHTYLQTWGGWPNILRVLKRMTPPRRRGPKMAAMRVLLPRMVGVGMKSQDLRQVDTVSGLLARLRESPVEPGTSAVVLRGRSDVLARAADELVAFSPGVVIYALGELAAVDYRAKQLWPALEDAPPVSAADRAESLWIHKDDPKPFWVDLPYETANRPTGEWTKSKFAGYIDRLVYGRLRHHLATPIYGGSVDRWQHMDPEGIRVRLILEAFGDPAARPHITPSALKRAVSFMAKRGGHRAAAERLVEDAKTAGIPMDADVLNAMLFGYVASHDARRFHLFLAKMLAGGFQANTQTWLLFLQLLQQDDVKDHVVLEMYKMGLFGDMSTRGGLAPVMAQRDAYTAFRSGSSMQDLLAAQEARYGASWLTEDGRRRMLREFLLFKDPSARLDEQQLDGLRLLLARPSEHGAAANAASVNILVEFAAKHGDWPLALWALDQMHRSGVETDRETYEHLILLSIRSRSPHCLATAFFYGCIERKLNYRSRSLMRRLLLGEFGFFRMCRPKLLSAAMTGELRKGKRPHAARIVSVVERLALGQLPGGAPVLRLGQALVRARVRWDQPMAAALSEWKMQKGQSGAPPPDVQPVPITLRLPDDPSRVKCVHLCRRFSPATMVENWSGGRKVASGKPSGAVGDHLLDDDDGERSQPGPNEPDVFSYEAAAPAVASSTPCQGVS